MADSVSITELHIASTIEDNSTRLLDVWPELLARQTELAEMKKYLLEIERKKEVAHNDLVRSYFADLRELADQAEDVIDAAVLHRSHFRWPWENKASKQLQIFLQQMQAVKAKLETHIKQTNNAPRVGRSLASGSQSFIEEDDYVVGIDGDVNKLVKRLVSKQSLDVLTIVGMGGSGKTTLAKKIYNHKSAKKSFNYQAWVVFSQWSGSSAVLFEILRQITAKSQKGTVENTTNEDGHGLSLLGTRIQNELKGKTCLFVLDDVCEPSSIGEILSVLLRDNNEPTKPQKVIITSRLRVSPTETRLQWDFYQTQRLSEGDSWKLLENIASKSGKGLDKEYSVLAKEMLKTCQGLPLAIVALGKHLKTKDTVTEWEKMFSKMEGPERAYLYRSVNNILGLSYDGLPYYLKPCFLYLGLFPKGSDVSAGRLIRMWIAEGFVSKSNEEKTLEEAGRRCLQGLIDHNMIQVVRRNYDEDVKTVRVHDLMWDFCIMIAQESDFVTMSSVDSDFDSRHARRTAVNLSMNLPLPVENLHLRSLVLFGETSPKVKGDIYAKKHNQVLLNLAPVFETFKLLRILDLTRIKTSDGTLPKEIGGFIHLRYLNIRSTNIRELPRSIGKLRNLLTLDYWDVSVDSGVTIPNVLWKLKRLRHLYLPNEMSRGKGELKLQTLKNLQVLWGLGGGKWMLKELKILGSSLKKLYIQGISSTKQMEAVFNSHAVAYDHLRVLALDWYGFELESVEALCSKTNLKKLRLMGKALDESKPFEFPSSLQKLELYFTQLGNPESMSALGRLQGLKSLKLSKDSYLGEEWTCDGATFPVLEELKLSNLRKLKEWKIERGSMPCLKKLSIVSCINLRRIPIGLKLIQTLEKLEIVRMPYSFCSRLRQVEGKKTDASEDYYIIQHIPSVTIVDACSTPL